MLDPGRPLVSPTRCAKVDLRPSSVLGSLLGSQAALLFIRHRASTNKLPGPSSLCAEETEAQMFSGCLAGPGESVAVQCSTCPHTGVIAPAQAGQLTL